MRLTSLHRERLADSEKGWSSDFPPLPSAFSPKWAMALVLRSHNGVHCCGTVGDSHSHSQLIAAKRTFTGDSSLNHVANIQHISNIPNEIRKKRCTIPVFGIVHPSLYLYNLKGIIFECIEHCREVTLAGIGQQHHNLLALVLWALCYLSSSVEGCTC